MSRCAGMVENRNTTEQRVTSWSVISPYEPAKKFRRETDTAKIIDADNSQISQAPKLGSVNCLPQIEKGNEDMKLHTNYKDLKDIYETITSDNFKTCDNFNNYLKSVIKCFVIVENYLSDDLMVKIKNENINKQEKLILDCVMIGTSILCELSDENDAISLKIGDDDTIISILYKLVDKLSNEIKQFSISDQLIENIVFICLNVARRDSKTKINDIITKLRYCINIDNMNPVIKVGVALTFSYVGDSNDEETLIIKQLIKKTIDKIIERKTNNWCGLSLNELNEGFTKLFINNESSEFKSIK